MLDSFFWPFQGPNGLPGAPGLPGDPGLMGEKVSMLGRYTVRGDQHPAAMLSEDLYFFISSMLAFLSRVRTVLLGMAQLDSQVPQ